MRALWCLRFFALVCCLRTVSLAQTPTFQVTSSLTLVDVFVEDQKTGLPVRDLTEKDFRILDNGHAVSIASFDSGAKLDTRPVALWLVTICNQDLSGDRASRTFAGKETGFRAPLNYLDLQDAIGVAHWCDNGDAALDLPAGKNRDAPISTLKEVLKPIPFFMLPPGSRIGEFSFQRMVRMIIRAAHRTNPRPLPVLVMLHGDYDGMPLPELDRLTDDFLETTGVMFGIRNSALPESAPLTNGEQGEIFRYMADQTGGSYYSVPPERFGDALASIIVQLHFRYQLGFKPLKIDGKRHSLKVELTREAKKKHKHIRLRARRFYIPLPVEPRWTH